MTINLSVPSNNETPELKPRITVIGVGGAGGNAVNNMIDKELEGVDFVVANDVSRADIGFNSADNCVTVVGPAGAEALPKMSKRALSAQLLHRFAAALRP